MATNVIPKLNRSWILVQTKTFTRWANTYLNHEGDEPIRDLIADIPDGKIISRLLQVLTGKSIDLPNLIDRKSVNGEDEEIFLAYQQKIENSDAILGFLSQTQKIPLPAISAQDIVEQNAHMVLGLMWTLVVFFQLARCISITQASPRSVLLSWVNDRISTYEVPPPRNFLLDWKSGRVLASLLDSMQPGIFPPEEWKKKDSSALVAMALQIADSKLTIPKLLDPEDIVFSPEELSLMTYVSMFRDYEMWQESGDADLVTFQEFREGKKVVRKGDAYFSEIRFVLDKNSAVFIHKHPQVKSSQGQAKLEVKDDHLEVIFHNPPSECAFSLVVGDNQVRGSAASYRINSAN
eukprot:TRINITY_DN8011_c0_g1_i1.p1 TRINITY_DN8011_c0_g1~~TRINITY_DN8011_c0_g1_i1.p1  ORF type:complete len:350 (-),score=133.66 TRINITY_DN8011_c0_g1_i1:27-1076(-)